MFRCDFFFSLDVRLSRTSEAGKSQGFKKRNIVGWGIVERFYTERVRSCKVTMGQAAGRCLGQRR